ncbi:DUF4244 domain-containing protein [Actinomycetaceae bacterium WB03_NA08]|uniref:DUF4244 domain-containing protein n=2 Tax=Scrofimicrobium canadense TaxID=2652290 RepID=A0A6N7VNL6_9ACTO|nr:DUF4244 domain-containing protein [Scrofimicrobium canadense]
MEEEIMHDAVLKTTIDAQLWMEGALVSPEAEEGSTTVEYAIGAIATAGFAGLLIAVLKSGGVKSLLTNIIQSALSL